jgi:hypothetical protein
LKYSFESVSRIGVFGFRICFEFLPAIALATAGRALDFEFIRLLVYRLCSEAKNEQKYDQKSHSKAN